MIRYLSLCSSIEAASVAWQPVTFKDEDYVNVHPCCLHLWTEE